MLAVSVSYLANITLNHPLPLSPPSLSADRNELEAAQKFLEQAAIENLVSILVFRWCYWSGWRRS